MTVTVRVTRATDGLGRHVRDPLDHDVTATDPWWCVASPTVAGAWTAYRDRDAAVEHSARLYLRLGAVQPVELSDGLPT